MKSSRAVVIAVAAAAAIGAIVGPAPSAYAGLTPVVEERTSLFGLSSPRSITVECPSGSWVFAVGGQIIGNNGSVLMTRMSPSDDLKSAIVEAKVRGNPT